MKRFIVISLLSAAALRLLACSGPDIKNYYVFSAYAHDDWNNRIQELCNSNWRSYLGSKDEYFWFDADEVMAAARKKGDQLMVSYVRNLKQYLDCAEAARSDVWDYPTKQDLAKRRQTLTTVAGYARQKLNTRLRSQHGLLLMRCQMMLGQHQQNVAFWEQTASKYINSVYRDMMQNIYAGALLKTGRTDEATALFMQMGDTESLYTYYYKKRSCQAIADEYKRNPQSAALPFLVQDFVNNAQEAADYQHDGEYGYWPGKLFIRDISDQERKQFIALCNRVLNEGKTKQPVMWQSAKAWLHYLGNEHKDAIAAIDKALTMQGTPHQQNNARTLQIFITCATTKQYDQKFDNFLAQSLQWLEEKGKENGNEREGAVNHSQTSDFNSQFYQNVYNRLSRTVLVPRYLKQRRYTAAAALLGAYDEMTKRSVYDDVEALRQFKTEYKWNPDYDDVFFRHLDTIPVNQVVDYAAYLNKAPQTPLDQWLHSHVRKDADFFADLIGTKYLRLMDWNKAIQWLSKVTIGFVNHQNITPYAVARSYKVEQWLNKQKVKDAQPGSVLAKQNQKLLFAQEMSALDAKLQALAQTNASTDSPLSADNYNLHYNAATRLFQASCQGQCWFLTRYGHSFTDTVRTNERDFIERAAQLLSVSAKSPDFSLRQRSYYALAFLPYGSPWRTEEWSDAASDFVYVSHPNTHQYRALARLADFAEENSLQTDRFVTKCDVLKQFRKQYRK